MAGQGANVKALVIVSHENGPAARFRIYPLLDRLRQRSIDATVIPFVDAAFHRVLYKKGHSVAKAWHLARALVRAAILPIRALRYDVILVQREACLIGPPLIEWMLSILRPLVYDFDDAVYLAPSGLRGLRKWLRNPEKTSRIIKRSTIVLAGNQTLAKYALLHNQAVRILPTVIDTAYYRPGNRRNTVPVIGWTGSKTTLEYIRRLTPALERLAKQHTFELHIIANDIAPWQITGVNTKFMGWEPDKELQRIQSFDIGLMPLPDDEWTRGKCGLKALQYMACGVATVVSPVGMNRELIANGDSGLHATTDEEWCRAVSSLLEDEALRARLGTNGRLTVASSYSLDTAAPILAAALLDAGE